MQTGIYEIVNTVNGKRYVGSSVDIAARWKAHVRELRRGTHHAQHLQRSFDKYGEGKFILVIIRYCERDDLIAYEQEELDIGFDYNSSPTAGNTLGFKFSPEARERVRQNRLKRMKEGNDLSEQMMRMSKMPKSDLWKQKMSERTAGVPKTASQVEKMAKARAAISEDDVRKIRKLCADGMFQRTAGEMFGLSQQSVQRIVSGKRYKWVV